MRLTILLTGSYCLPRQQEIVMSVTTEWCVVPHATLKTKTCRGWIWIWMLWAKFTCWFFKLLSAQIDKLSSYLTGRLFSRKRLLVVLFTCFTAYHHDTPSTLWPQFVQKGLLELMNAQIFFSYSLHLIFDNYNSHTSWCKN